MRLRALRSPGRKARAARARRVPRWTESLHVWVVASFAVAQPLYVLLAEQAEFFVFQNAGRGEIMGLVLVLSVLLPLGLIATEQAAGLLGRRVRRWIHHLILSMGIALTVLPALRPLESVSGVVLVYVAFVVGVSVVMFYARFDAVRLFFTLLAPSVVLFPGILLGASPVTPLLWQKERALALERAPIGSPAPIVFIVLDEFPVTSLLDGSQRIDAGRYPNFAALARNATWYRRATTVAETTYDALPAILTGRYPSADRLPHALDHPHNLFTLLAGTYALNAAGTLTQLCPEDLCIRDDDRSVAERLPGLLSDLAIVYLHLLLSAELRDVLPSIDHKWKGFGRETSGADPRSGADTRNDQLPHVFTLLGRHRDDRWRQALEFIATIRASDRPRLYFLHLMLPHDPYVYLPSGRRYSTEDRLPGRIGRNIAEFRYVSDRWNVLQLYQRHLLQVGAVDTWLGELLRHLRRIGLYDEALLVLTADHGVSFRPGEYDRRATETTFQDIMPVPLFIKAPFQEEGRIDDRQTEVVDILPSVAALIETTLPWPVDGRAVHELPPAGRRPRIHHFPDGTPETFTGLNEAMDRAATRRHELFGSGRWYPDLFTRDPHRSLVGRKTEEVATHERADVEVTLDQAAKFTDVDPESGFVPAHITGRISAGTGAHEELALAVAVNGTIEAVTVPWKVPIGGREGSWTAVVPETVFRPGENTVEVLAVTGGEGEVRVARLPASWRGETVDTAWTQWESGRR